MYVSYEGNRIQIRYKKSIKLNLAELDKLSKVTKNGIDCTYNYSDDGKHYSVRHIFTKVLCDTIPIVEPIHISDSYEDYIPNLDFFLPYQVNLSLYRYNGYWKRFSVGGLELVNDDETKFENPEFALLNLKPVKLKYFNLKGTFESVSYLILDRCYESYDFLSSFPQIQKLQLREGDIEKVATLPRHLQLKFRHIKPNLTDLYNLGFRNIEFRRMRNEVKKEDYSSLVGLRLIIDHEVVFGKEQNTLFEQL